MKKLLTLTLFAATITSASASCMYEKTDPICSIWGKTYSDTCQWWSDTSSWSIPKAYNGTCNTTPELTKTEKDRVYDIIINHLESKDYLKVSYSWEGYTLTGDSFWTQDKDGIYFISKLLFPAIAKSIATENNKTIPNTKKIAVLNEVVNLIWYDWYIEKK